MRCKLLSLLAVTLSIGDTQLLWGADMPLKAPVSPAAAYNWTGWYVGGNVGYGWGINSGPGVSVVDPAGPGFVGFSSYFAAGGNRIQNLNPRGIIGGGEIGYNWSWSPSWVVGLVADFQGSGITAAATNMPTAPSFGVAATTAQSNADQIDWFGTVRAKFGFAENNWLLYATSGLAYGRVATSGSFICVSAACAGLNFAGANSATNVGGAVGAGLDYGLTSNWIVGVEYLYIDLGKQSYTETQPALTPSTLTISNRAAANIVRASLDYKF